MINSSFLKKFILGISIISFASCDTDYNDIGADIIDDDVHHDMIRYNAGLTAYDRPTGAVQANNLDVNMLGVLDNTVFGKTIAHFVTQVEMESVNPTITENAVIDSVYLYVPYYSTVESTTTVGGDVQTTYVLDSIYGNKDHRINLSVYRNGFFLRDTDPGSTDGQRYFSDDINLVEDNVGSLLAQDSEFLFSNVEIPVWGDSDPDDEIDKEVVDRLAPGIFMHLNKEVFQAAILEAGSSNLVNNNVFKNYFRGIYFQVAQNGNQQVMAVPKFDEGTVTIVYTDDKFDLNGDPVDEDGNNINDQESKTLTLKLAGNTVNFFETVKNPDFANAIASSDNVNGDERLYVKGGDGSVAFIDINMADLDALKEENIGQKVLINEANILFYIDEAAMAGVTEPMRVYLYDVNNKRPLYDYYTDVTTNNSDPKKNKGVHSGLKGYKDDNGNGQQDEGEPSGYRIRITNHINNIVNKDSTNVRLGLVVTESINLIGNAALKAPLETEDIDVIPVSSVMNPFGTVLYGSNNAVSEDRRLKLEIFYTKPN